MSEEEHEELSEAGALSVEEHAFEAIMSDKLRRLLRLALELPRHGAALLEWLGQFDVWRGDLTAMRGDSPAYVAPPFREATPAVDTSLLDVLATRKAFLSLDEACRSAVRAAALDAAAVSGNEIARRRLRGCVDRLELKIVSARRQLATDGEHATEVISELLRA